MSSSSSSSPSSQSSTDIQIHEIPEFKFVNGASLRNLKVAYKSINPQSQHGTVLIPTCFGGRIAGTFTFTQSPNDALSKYHVMVVAMLGNGESSSPSNTPGFPQPGELHYQDIIRSQQDLLTRGLGIPKLQAVVGFSMGGQQAYHWATMYPDLVQRIVGICTSARTSPHNFTFLEGPIAALENSADYTVWKQAKTKQDQGHDTGHALDELTPKQGLAGFSRAYAAWLTSAEWFRAQKWKDLGASTLADWLRQGENQREHWSPDDLLVLARMWQMGDIGRVAAGMAPSQTWNNEDDSDLENALRRIQCPVLLMPNRSDQYFRPRENEFEMRYLSRGRLEVIESDWGHVSGGGACSGDAAFMNEKIKEFLDSTC